MNFLRQIGPILSNVNLELCVDSLDDLGIILANLMPLLNSVRSLCFSMDALLTVKQCFGEEFNKIKVLELNYHRSGAMNEQAQADVLLNWLISPRQDNGPRYCKAFLSSVLFGKISPAIRQVIFLSISTKLIF